MSNPAVRKKEKNSKNYFARQTFFPSTFITQINMITDYKTNIFLKYRKKKETSATIFM